MEEESSSMNAHLSHRRRRVPLIMAPAILCSLAASLPAIGAPSGTMLFDGAGFGPTVDVAIQSAIWDAEASAGASQFYTCELAGQPQIFPGPNPALNRNFTAQVTLSCTS
ncbi:hypothetical protein [Inquilinus sp. CA228]|uniref:hypothetical protein n=1 Tax=Inquilinus sp. CA228 TaxID=3455609 RepID=UPI003F8D8E8D